LAVKKRQSVRLTNSDKLNLERFGCAFREGVFYIDWKEKRPSQAANAGIFACLGRVDTTSGPIVLLAFEISVVRPLPSYCYFPFDLKNSIHKKYLSSLTKNGEIKFHFLADKGAYTRSHSLTPYLRLSATEVLAETARRLEVLDKYDFDEALRLTERYVRISEFVNRLLLEDTITEISQGISEAVKTVPNENREFANAITNRVAEAFAPYYRKNRNTMLEFVQHTSKGFTYIKDLHRIFADNPTALTTLFRDGLAASFSKKELEAISELVIFFLYLISLFREEELQSTSESIRVPELPAGMTDLVRSMKTSGISKDAASKFLHLIGLETGGRPGRPTKDYSREYELKRSGYSWTEVARQAMAERPELQAEFGGRGFDDLDSSDQEKVWQRIRQGVRAYAERTGKPLPSELEVLDTVPELTEKKTTDK
jgi:hypothetical protein